MVAAEAQEAALDAAEGAANAMHDFLLDFMAAQRAVGSFRMFWSEAEREAWFDRLESYYVQRGVAPRGG